MSLLKQMYAQQKKKTKRSNKFAEIHNEGDILTLMIDDEKYEVPSIDAFETLKQEMENLYNRINDLQEQLRIQENKNRILSRNVENLKSKLNNNSYRRPFRKFGEF